MIRGFNGLVFSAPPPAIVCPLPEKAAPEAGAAAVAGVRPQSSEEGSCDKRRITNGSLSAE